jgi:hypothetical protein
MGKTGLRGLVAVSSAGYRVDVAGKRERIGRHGTRYKEDRHHGGDQYPMDLMDDVHCFSPPGLCFASVNKQWIGTDIPDIVLRHVT